MVWPCKQNASKKLPEQALLFKANGRRPGERPRTAWTDYNEDLGWNCLGLHPSEMIDVMEDCEVWRFNFELQPPQPEVESRTQGSRPRPRTQKNPRPRIDPLEAKDQGHRRKCSPKKKVFKNFFQAISKKKGLQKFFSGEKGLQKIFFRRSLLEETTKKIFANFPQDFWRFPTKFQRFKNSAVLEPRTGQFSRT